MLNPQVLRELEEHMLLILEFADVLLLQIVTLYLVQVSQLVNTVMRQTNYVVEVFWNHIPLLLQTRILLQLLQVRPMHYQEFELPSPLAECLHYILQLNEYNVLLYTLLSRSLYHVHVSHLDEVVRVTVLYVLFVELLDLFVVSQFEWFQCAVVYSLC